MQVVCLARQPTGIIDLGIVASCTFLMAAIKNASISRRIKMLYVLLQSMNLLLKAVNRECTIIVDDVVRLVISSDGRN